MAIIRRHKTRLYVIAEDEEGFVYSADGVPAAFTLTELEGLLKVIGKTLASYKDKGITNDKIKKENAVTCQQFFEDLNRITEPKIRPGLKPTFVYVMLDTANDFYKIGRSLRPYDREETLQAEKPTIELLKAYPAKEQDERFLHGFFQEKRIRGEWFRLLPDDLKVIDNYFSLTGGPQCQ